MQVVATMFCISWIVCNLMRVYFYFGSSSLVIYLWIDAIQAVMIGLIYMGRPSWWSRMVCVSLYAQMVCHLIFWFLKAVLEAHTSNRGYTMIINILYALQLTSLTIAAAQVVASRWWRWHLHPAIKLLTADHRIAT
ncbi:hypothetical protein HOU02_gp428 [Caulobacter phage CcrBL9]|uniref:Uncharacterized protein n=1 Tax=Caulobacter phage CcrBL9 TaxID=2283270 RepID=A0A385EER3_9CAUD|nr:hypothetical protein HOU02_gp428 [Caulobacter phage CcrBL9]AXQ69297.1 hypothetical protein CcrBL9_gp273c [Caulobacter phage CcrBL9]